MKVTQTKLGLKYQVASSQDFPLPHAAASKASHLFIQGTRAP